MARQSAIWCRLALVTLASCVLAAPASASAAPTYPFGSRPMSYAAGTIRPSHVSDASLDQSVRDFYDGWKVAVPPARRAGPVGGSWRLRPTQTT